MLFANRWKEWHWRTLIWSGSPFDPAYVVRRDAPLRGKVGVVSGGGSGHEPMHGGYVGRGMLDAAVPGQVFTSPTPDQIEAATRAVVLTEVLVEAIGEGDPGDGRRGGTGGDVGLGRIVVGRLDGRVEVVPGIAGDGLLGEAFYVGAPEVVEFGLLLEVRAGS